MDTIDIVDYKCSSCKKMHEPNYFGWNERTGARLKTCNMCRRKRLDREAALAERRAAEFNNLFVTSEPTEPPQPETQMVVYIPAAITTSDNVIYFVGEPDPEPRADFGSDSD